MIALKLAIRRAIDGAAWAAGMGKIPTDSLSILMYHAVTRTTFNDASQMSVSAARFAEHLRVLSQAPVDMLGLDEAVRRLVDGTLYRAAATVVFDDGFVGVHDHAAELLAARRIPATVYVRTAHIGSNSFPEADAALGRPLTWDEVRALSRGGIAIGSHTHSHPRLGSLGPVEITRELRESRDRISDEVGVTPRAFAYPFGAYGTFNAATRQALLDEGFRSACTTVWGRNRPGHDVLELKRMRLSWVDRPEDLRRSLAGCHDWYRGVQQAQHLLAPMRDSLATAARMGNVSR
jgi:peptidoglycan/xylan/chitin deacetylase (PgdA/CDA1 family)